MRRIACAVALAVSLVGWGGGHATAKDSSPSSEVILELARRYESASPTTSDEAFIQRHPEIGATIIDPRRTEIGIRENGGAPLSLARATSCHYSDRYMIVKSALGGKLYTYHTVINTWCENGSAISSSTFSDYFSDINGAAMKDPRSGLIHQLKKPAANHWVAYTGGSIDNCIFKVGCVGTKYPAQQISHYAGKGGLTYQWFNRDDSTGWHHE
jgi:hypothetical protein